MDGPLYPVGLVVKGRPCLVVGGGRVAARKVASLLQCGAAVTMVAPEAHEAVGILAAAGVIAAIEGPPLDVQLRPYRRGEAAGYRLVVTATGDPEVDAAVHGDAEAAGVWVNSADDPAHCSFVLPAVWRAGAVSVAVSTEGTSPALAVWLRDQVGAWLGPELAELAELVGELRARLQAEGRSTGDVAWTALLGGRLPDLVRRGLLDEARALLERAARPPGGDGAGEQPRA
jgi:precorrin-2 dehydrogenase/sirohydrochlorin ferrochelatase